jgi:uncharacterized protein (DUF488 family)
MIGSVITEEQIDELVEKTYKVTLRLTGTDKIAHKGTYRMFMSRREQLKDKLRAACVTVSPRRTRPRELGDLDSVVQ